MRLLSLASCLLAAGTQAAVLRTYLPPCSLYPAVQRANISLKIGSSPESAPLRVSEDAFVARQASGNVTAAGNVTSAGDVNAAASYWLEDIQHQGRSAFNKNPNGYKVFRNVKDYGARGE
jgi:glucan 1,3-beta-glucosidase